jgi:hypothetical protein
LSIPFFLRFSMNRRFQALLHSFHRDKGHGNGDRCDGRRRLHLVRDKVLYRKNNDLIIPDAVYS